MMVSCYHSGAYIKDNLMLNYWSGNYWSGMLSRKFLICS